MYDRMLAYPRLLKTAVAVAHLAMIYLSYKIFTAQLDEELVFAALAVSGFWLGLTTLRLNSLLRTYFDHLSRMQVVIPCIAGLMLASLAAFSTMQSACKLLALVEICAWLAVYAAYRRNRLSFSRQGHGPLPKNTWLSPDAAALQPGDLILTSGRMAGKLHDSVGHAELVIPDESGKLYALSSYMETGACYVPLADVIAELQDKNIHYIAVRLKTPLTSKQSKEAPIVARELWFRNVCWRKSINEKRKRLLAWLPLPAGLRSWVEKKVSSTGYDWVGLFIGTRARNRWTCIGICIECLKRLNVPVGNYGTGMLGLGTGILDPIQPVRLLADKAYRLVDLSDKARHEAGNSC